MTEVEFWDLIDRAALDAETVDEVVDKLRAILESMSREDIVAFQRNLNNVMVRAYTWELIAAACFFGCGQSDDGFEDFRAWLVAQGRDTFETVLKDVNALADIPYDESPTEEWYCEELHMLPGEVGGQVDDLGWPSRRDPKVPYGNEITLTKDELRRRFPELWAKFENRFMIGIA